MKRIREFCILLFAALTTRCLSKELTEIETLTSKPVRCSYERAYDMYGAHCAGLKLNKIPSLKGGLEILDFSDNKLRKLHADTFSGYSGIRFLYLAENQIFMVDDDAFMSMTSLQTLDLSRNAITELPTGLFQLPSLRTLYLNGNPLIHLDARAIALSKPIKAPLEILDISDCELRIIPDLGMLPHLTLFNVSHNPLISLEAKTFAQACKLKKVDITGSIDGVPLCELRPTITWFEDNKIYFELGDYSRLNSKEFQMCPRDDLPMYLNATYRQCKSEIVQTSNVRGSRRTWLTIGGGLAGFLVGFILLLYVMHRRNVAQTKQEVKKNTPVQDPDKQATAILLNNVAA